MKLVIKLPVKENGKFKLQSSGNFPGRRYKTAARLLQGLSSVFLRTGLNEKIEIIVKKYIGGHFEEINGTFPSNERGYLLYCTTCFLEDYISKNTLRKSEKRLIHYLISPNMPEETDRKSSNAEVGGFHSVGQILLDKRYDYIREGVREI